jgi:heme/copper-type cytochrome/quinol oxidase subunit 2
MLTVSASEEVEFRATSVDVIHGFWISPRGPTAVVGRAWA